MTTKKSSHIGIGLLAGTILGVAAAVFLQTPKGKKVTKDMQKKTNALQAKIMKELKTSSNVTKEKYAAVVEQVVAYYAKSRDVAKSELPEVRDYLLGEWRKIEKELKSAKK